MRAVFITEGKKDIGFGHITRCLGIIDAFEEKKVKTLLIVNGDKSILNLVKKKNFKIIDWVNNEDKLFSILKSDDLVVVDSYLANSEFYEKISKLARLTAYIDDNNRLFYPNGVVINGNIYGSQLKYKKNKASHYLLGPKYAPIRKEFWDSPTKKISKTIKNILITFGGDDKRDLTPKVLTLIQKNYPNTNIKVIIGNGFKNKSKIKKLLKAKAELIISPNPIKLKKTMIKSDLAISASGQTTLELLRLGIPAVIIKVADNQSNIAKVLTEKHLVSYGGDWKDKPLLRRLSMELKKLENYEKRKNMSNLQKKIIDGYGARRLVDFLINKSRKKILFVSNNKITLDLADWLRDVKKENVVVFNKKLTKEVIEKYNPDFLVSYNYKYIIDEEVLSLFSKGRAINLHISYLPWNRGSNPNIWSFIEKSPKGVTIHAIDKGIDTGDILIQKKVNFNLEKETLSSSYLKLHKEIKILFKDNWEKIKNMEIKPKKQLLSGSTHTLKDFDKIKSIINQEGWNTKINNLIKANEKY